MARGWQGSTRRATLPANWKTLRKIVEARAGGRCEQLTPLGRCPRRGTDCDHVGDPHNHHPSNLQWLCNPHHLKKTGQQAAQTRAARRAQGRQPAPPHPGLLG